MPLLTVEDCTLPLHIQGHWKAPGGNELCIQEMKCHKLRGERDVKAGVRWDSDYVDPAVVLHAMEHPLCSEEMQIVAAVVHKVGESHRCMYEK